MTVKHEDPDAAPEPPAPSGGATGTLASSLSPYEQGFLIGLLVGEGSFGGDGRQPQVSLRMHTRHEAIFRWLEQKIPNARLYGPYHHGGRSYFQWMARGRVLVRDLLPLLEAHINPEVDGHAAARLAAMTERYAEFIAREVSRPVPAPVPETETGTEQPEPEPEPDAEQHGPEAEKA